MLSPPDKQLDAAPLLSKQEFQQLTVEWNRTARPYDQHLTVTELFESVVQKGSSARAVVSGKDTLTYGELNERANRLARHLRDRGAKPDSLIALCVDRTSELIVAMLAILKSGAAYLPLDPAHPSDRIAQVIRDAGAILILTEERYLHDLPIKDVDAICLDRDAAQWAALSAENLTSTAGPKNLAYVMYTSGSTGKPKGVEIRHYSVVNFLQSMQVDLSLKHGETVLALTTVTFDISVLEIFLPLISGGCIELLTRSTVVDAVLLRAAIERSEASLIQATPMTWRMLLETGWKGNSSARLLCGGEALASDLATELLQRGGSLWNMFGPTETTVWSTMQRIDKQFQSITVGRPIANTNVYILDSELQPVPTGVAGELYLGGHGVARGYRGRPDLTEERFIPSPFVQGDVIYKTGDLARFDSDGLIEHMGRLDHQIKLRGYRIELGEIEAVICEHSAISAAAVVLSGQAAEEQQLVAYVVASSEGITAQVIRDFLAARLPEYMVPPVIVFLDQFPLTSSGKVDRRALPAPVLTSKEPDNVVTNESQYSRLESQIYDVWCETLRVPRIPAGISFFELGGHSLLALRVTTRISAILGRQVPVTLLFCCPTITSFAKALQQPETYEDKIVICLRQVDGTTPLFMIPPIGAELYSYRNLLSILQKDRTVYGINFWHSSMDLANDRTLEELAQRCAASILETQTSGPYLLMGYSFGGILAYEIARNLLAAGKQIQFVGVIDSDLGGMVSLTLKERCLGVYRFFQNVPSWTSHSLRSGSFSKLPGRIGRKAARVFQRLLGLDPSDKHLLEEPSAEAHNGKQLSAEMSLRRKQQFDRVAESKYQSRPSSIKIHLFRASIPALSVNLVADVVWRRVALGGIRVHRISGHHITMMHQPGVGELSNALDSAIAASEKERLVPSEPIQHRANASVST